MNLKGKVALVTGSSRGIGASIIEELASLGCNVVINYHSDQLAALDVQNKIEKYNVKSIVVKCDVSKEEEVLNMRDIIIEEFNKIDILINNAAIAIDTVFEDKTVDNFRKIIDINLIGTFLVSKYIGQIMLNQKSGKIINIASTNAIDTYYPESLDYDASKAGVISLTHNLAKQFAPFINVNCVAPGWVNTDMNKDLDNNFIEQENKKILLNRFANPVEIAKVVSFLVSDDASYINSSIIRVDGGKND